MSDEEVSKNVPVPLGRDQSVYAGILRGDEWHRVAKEGVDEVEEEEGEDGGPLGGDVLQAR